MGLINVASGNSVWKGLDYYRTKKVIEYNKLSDSEYNGNVIGSYNNYYNVLVNIDHPKKSKCDCPHAKDKRIICKHIVALYFEIFPDEADKFLKEVEESQQEYEEYEEKLYQKTIKHINLMSKKELEEALIELLDIAPDWVYDRFVRHKVGF